MDQTSSSAVPSDLQPGVEDAPTESSVDVAEPLIVPQEGLIPEAHREDLNPEVQQSSVVTVEGESQPQVTPSSYPEMLIVGITPQGLASAGCTPIFGLGGNMCGVLCNGTFVVRDERFMPSTSEPGAPYLATDPGTAAQLTAGLQCPGPEALGEEPTLHPLEAMDVEITTAVSNIPGQASEQEAPVQMETTPEHVSEQETSAPIPDMTSQVPPEGTAGQIQENPSHAPEQGASGAGPSGVQEASGSSQAFELLPNYPGDDLLDYEPDEELGLDVLFSEGEVSDSDDKDQPILLVPELPAPLPLGYLDNPEPEYDTPEI